MDLGILNTIIALVVVLLVLSLLVQAIQTLLKKLLKLKSKQIEDSLKDLYEQVVGAQPEPAPPTSSLSNVWTTVKSWLSIKRTAVVTPAEVFKDKVLDQFKSIGRQTLFGNAVLDSLSKSDLFKVMGKLESEDFFPDYVTKFQILCDQINDLRKAIEDITNDPALLGAASTKIAEIRSILAPIFNNVEAILDGKQVKPKVLFADLLRLGQLDFHGLLKLLDEAQESITREIQAATTANNTGEVAALQKISAELAQVSKLIGDLSQKFVDAISPLRNKIDQVELWFDTVTQSFDERYTRHMKTISIVISILVVILLNANFFQVYKSLSKNEIQRNMLVDAGADLVKDNNAPTSRPVASPSPNASPVASPNASPTPNPVAELKKDLRDIDSLVGTYEGFGFKPLSAEQLRAFVWSTGVWTRPFADDDGNYGWAGFKLSKELRDGNEIAHWYAQSGEEWWDSRKENLVTIVGWAIMVMLLSVGAPFWQDALESLFGIKNLLRQKSGTQNIETQSGAGQPKE
ncbi:MAG TPA: hypothetical protein VFI24_00220 [Pyrinomonadaceae bacterium]|nr:hypothetical protein [Pyrinomonadaceae bacterium]